MPLVFAKAGDTVTITRISGKDEIRRCGEGTHYQPDGRQLDRTGERQPCRARSLYGRADILLTGSLSHHPPVTPDHLSLIKTKGRIQ